MNENGNGRITDLRTLLALADNGDPETTNRMLANALLYCDYADDKLEQSRKLKVEAQKYREQTEREVVENTEEYCNSIKAEAAAKLEEAKRASEEAQAKLAEAQEQFDKANAVRAEAEEFKARTEEQAREQAKGILEQARAEALEETTEKRNQLAIEVTKALADIEKVKEASRAELEAQQMYTEALRMKARSAYKVRSVEETDIPEAAPKASPRPKAGKVKVTAAA